MNIPNSPVTEHSEVTSLGPDTEIISCGSGEQSVQCICPSPRSPDVQLTRLDSLTLEAAPAAKRQRTRHQHFWRNRLEPELHHLCLSDLKHPFVLSSQA